MFPVWSGDDEHTGADGAYARVLKARKWLYLSAVIAILHSYAAVDLDALGRALKGILVIPPWLATLSILATMAYLVMQYVALLIQFGSAYTSIIAGRLPDSDAQRSARENLSRHIRELESLAVRQTNPAEDRNSLQSQIADNERARDYHAGLLMKATKTQPTAQTLFRWPEYLVDWSRALLPLLVGIGGVLRLLGTMPGFGAER